MGSDKSRIIFYLKHDFPEIVNSNRDYKGYPHIADYLPVAYLIDGGVIAHGYVAVAGQRENRG